MTAPTRWCCRLCPWRSDPTTEPAAFAQLQAHLADAHPVTPATATVIRGAVLRKDEEAA